MALTAAHPPPSVPWYARPGDQVAARLGADTDRGLAAAEAAARLARTGPNALPEGGRRHWLRLLAGQFTDFMILLLAAAAVVSGIVGDIADTAVILGIVVLNGAIGFVQELRAERTMAALGRMAAPAATVLRDGRRQVVPAAALVPGDTVLLEAGGAVPADLRLTEAVALRTEEAALTGESLPVEKDAAALAGTDLPLAEQACMAFKGTSVVHGRGRGIVVATGAATELGRIAGMLAGGGETRTPLQRRLARFGRQLSLAALAICALVFLSGWLRGEPLLLMLLTALSLAVAAIPEAMPAVVTVLLARGAGRMARHQALVRRLAAVEALGAVTTICSDKTGTLTLNEMRVTDLLLDGTRHPAGNLDAAAEPGRTLLTALALCNDVARDASGAATGDPTEVALWRVAAEAGFDKAVLETASPRIDERPFDSGRKRMTTLHRGADGIVGYTKGAPETVLPCCTQRATEGGAVPLDAAAAAAQAEAMAADGLRVMAVAVRRWDAPPEDPEQGLVLLGFAGMLDPPRPEAAAAVATCRSAGIAPVMITGDHPVTARAIARRIGLWRDGDTLLTGRDLAAIPDDALRARVKSVRVYARVDPAQKIRIVAALQEAGEVVAMTGDGVNDAPALARAEVGVAMGSGGTDVAREAAGLILLDDNFATVVAAVREGRRIDDNIRKFVRFVVSCNAAEIATIFLAPFLGMPVPLLPIQILWMNLVTDGLPGLALAAEPAAPDIMRRKPRDPREGLFARGLGRQVAVGAAVMSVLCLATQAATLGLDLPHWRTMVFTVLTLSQMALILAIRTDGARSVLAGLLANRLLLGAVASTFLLQLMVIYLPPLNPLFGTAPLTGAELLACLALSAVMFLLRRRAR